MAKQARKDTGAKADTVTPPRVRRHGQRLTKEERAAAQELFLQVFSSTAILTAACKQAGVSRNTVYEWLEKDEPFNLRYHQAELEAQDVVRAAIHRRGIEGVDEPVISQGRLVFINEEVTLEDGTKVVRQRPLTVKKYSDTVLLRMAGARLPEYREKLDLTMQGQVTHDHTGEFDTETAALGRELIRRLTAGRDN
jgi:hypothetical protein